MKELKTVYGFCCRNCGCTSYISTLTTTTVLQGTCITDHHDQNGRMECAVAPGKKMIESRHQVLFCSNCHTAYHEAFSYPELCHSLSIKKLVYELDGFVFEEERVDRADSTAVTSMPWKSADAVACNNCGWKGTVRSGSSSCPNCDADGKLTWQHEEKPEVPSRMGAYYINENRKDQ